MAEPVAHEGMFLQTARFSRSLELMQRVPATLLPKLLARILPAIRSKQKEEIFAAKELVKLEKMLELSSSELATVRCVVVIFIDVFFSPVLSLVCLPCVRSSKQERIYLSAPQCTPHRRPN